MTDAPFLIGLTGSIGMGKSTTAKLFADQGVPVWDADAAVHRLYDTGGAAVPDIAAICPAATTEDRVDRAELTAWIGKDPDRMSRIEAIVHPLVARDRAQFIAASASPVLVLDIPLLFETGADDEVDMAVVVTTDPVTQRARVLARQGMTEERFEAILARQMPDLEKRRRADYIIKTNTLEAARTAVQSVLRDIRDKRHARNRAGHRNDWIRPGNR